MVSETSVKADINGSIKVSFFLSKCKTARLEERGPNAGSFDINCIRTSMDADCILLFRTEVQSYQEGLSSF